MAAIQLGIGTECRKPVQQTREGPSHARLRCGGERFLPSVSIGQSVGLELATLTEI